ncbi:NUDIX domain-containing protein [Robertkochia marina]|uniref:NUDIX domain-containing protein n=1 Tax=Robertkochia marina TaxID=1227945 RepID=A0A4S3LWV7_9FLAO|nr:NUDIX domain-containing protein [Robertkochia marina]THD65511.1 NUDIX domain-containing protein [Robertkochia marina]TRZ40841.1 NUDIX domain-containing protein [Robertkochia marina]
MGEWVDIWTKEGTPTGRKIQKSEAHAQGYYHPTIHLWIYNSKKEILLQKRALTKESFPGKWDVAVAGHISAGDSPEETVVRETREELGLTIHIEETEFIKVMRSDIKHSESFTDREHHHVYSLKKDVAVTHLILQKEEVAEAGWFPIDILTKYLEDPESFPDLVPFETGYLRTVITYLRGKF